MNKKFLLISQVFMTFIMAAIMSGLMSLFSMGPTLDWLTSWPLSFIIAWPITFALTMVAWPASMKLTGPVSKPRARKP